MSWIKLTQLSGRGSKLSERNVGKLQAREHVVAPSLSRGRQGHRSWPSRRLRLFRLNWSLRLARGVIGLKRSVIEFLLIPQLEATQANFGWWARDNLASAMSALSIDPLILRVFIGIIDDPDNQGTGIAVIFGVHAQPQKSACANDIAPDRRRKQLSNQKLLLGGSSGSMAFSIFNFFRENAMNDIRHLGRLTLASPLRVWTFAFLEPTVDWRAAIAHLIVFQVRSSSAFARFAISRLRSLESDKIRMSR